MNQRYYAPGLDEFIYWLNRRVNVIMNFTNPIQAATDRKIDAGYCLDSLESAK